MDERKLRSKRQESKVAKEINGRVQPASGALWGSKADVRSDLFLVECKSTLKDNYRLTFKVWDKIYKEAVKDNLRIPVMCIDLYGGKERVAVLRTDDILGISLNSVSIPICSSYRIRYELGSRFCLLNKAKQYDLAIISWDNFLDKVVPEYIER